MAVSPNIAWYRSFYWRIGITFVAFVVVILITQGLTLSHILSTEAAQDQYRAPVLAAQVAADLASIVERDPNADFDAHLKSAYPPERAGRYVYFAVPGRPIVANTAEAVPEGIRLTALSVFGDRPLALSDEVRPVTTTPVLVGREMAGLVLVLVLDPPASGIRRELGRLLSLPSTIVLIVATVLVALVIFNPARRRLAALEHAAHRLGEGELSARAPQNGGDEIARVAAAFNRMAGELEARDAALRTSDALRRQMMADVSHELKTPLTAMRGYIETLRMPDVAIDPERRDRYFDTIDRETRRLERIVKDLLDLARYEHGGVVLQQRVFDIGRLFQNVAGRHEREAQQRSVAVRIDVDRAADQIVADPDRIEQAIENLVSNALRHTPAGGTITLSASRNEGEVTLAVSDSGAGIAPEHLPHVFDRFYKVDASRAAESAGSGLGLSITRAIIERHGGAISATSEPGRTTFSIVLPQASVM